jgi:DNA-directed RNA polymerase specialized sigma24 family protein
MAVFDIMAGHDTVEGADPTAEAVLAAERERHDAARSKALWHAFSQLPARCRELLRILMASPPPSYAEVAAAMDLPVGSIGPTRARCLKRLRAALAGRISGGLSSS